MVGGGGDEGRLKSIDSFHAAPPIGIMLKIFIGVDLYTFVGARAPTMLIWAPPKVLWVPTTKVGTGITVTVL